MNSLVLAEHNNNLLNSATLHAVTAAVSLGEVHILVAGLDCGKVAEAATKIQGVTKVLKAEDQIYQNGLAENVAPLLVHLSNNYSHILAPATSNGKNILPRVAALLDSSQISEIIEVKDSNTFVRPIYAGNALATVQSSDTIKIITVRATGFDAANAENGNAAIENIEFKTDTKLSTYQGSELTKSERPELTSANIIISGGRGMQSGENFSLLEEIADKLGAAVGASRAAVDAGFVSNDYQVGQTGKVVAPDLYIAVGISGAIQHLAGMKDSKVIVAINKDQEAPIFQVSDYGLVGDLFNILPEFSKELDTDNL